MLEGDPPTFEIALTHFIVSDDVERSRRFYTEALGGKTVRSGEPSFVAPANSWIINVGGGPTDDKPTVTLETPHDPDRTSSFLNSSGLGHPSCVQRVERPRRGVPHTTERARERDSLLHARPRWPPDRGRPNHPGRQLAPVLDRQLMRKEAPANSRCS
jgi:catechol 2,3-dioxygenase-like lactoylglutathione lyase family enzyme